MHPFEHLERPPRGCAGAGSGVPRLRKTDFVVRASGLLPKFAPCGAGLWPATEFLQKDAK
jgi:hypothetical protein